MTMVYSPPRGLLSRLLGVSAAAKVRRAMMSPEINPARRRFLGAAAMIIAVGELGMIRAAHAQSSKTKPAAAPPIKPGTH